MAIIRSPESGLIIGDPENIPLGDAEKNITAADLKNAVDRMILSSSGWRTVFAENGDEENRESGISPVYRIIMATGAAVFADYLKKTSGSSNPAVIVGLDTRPTGQSIADVMIRAFLSEGCRVRYIFITAAPEIMAYARYCGAKPAGSGGDAQGFAYISASHNPIGHNGLKFGLIDGGVLPAPEADGLIQEFRRRIALPDAAGRAVTSVTGADIPALTEIYSGVSAAKQEAYRAYYDFTLEVVTGTRDTGRQNDLLETVKRGIARNSLGLVADFNGSARTMSIDREFYTSLGLKFRTMNDKPREIAHRIVPEGESLEPCRLWLEELHGEDPSIIMGYVPDCDGDRGNIVFWDDRQGKARSLEAQEVFALACVSELAHLVWTGELRYDLKGNALDKVALAVNGPTSLRIDRIAQAFDVPVFRAEVGEPNVVGLARKLREKGYTVRILGEGAAGGNITHPSAVRDPVDTILALIKLLTIRSEGEKMGFFELWCDLSDQAETYRADFTLTDVIAALPAFVTTGAYVADALLKVKTADHSVLKNRYQKIFLREWEEKKDHLKKRYGITQWEAAAFVGMEEKNGLANFGEAGNGGLKILFSNESGHTLACIWMRGSKTEPVFRVMADAEGSDPRLERELIEWQRRMVTEADSAE
ncbi:phosphatidylglycerol lysyltransferase [Breznakiella homolactica]|uniref:Phosphatidylglycerol lysyltransferase n=1 Tax=Breznakiella homolactica TaxID=2798577 RepID=A0A7T7XRS0_9SPIR|nr:phosphatidylglycerol lysyltransferase [Breznakiella homolactica]QQO11257.1 phosphatidylglycerol lysyltransferase [Breznakiella homolactica]